MKVLVLNPSSGDKVVREGRCSFKSIFDYTFPPVALSYITSCIQKYGHEVFLVDSNIRKHSVKRMVKIALDFDVVVMNTTTPTFNSDVKLAKSMKGLKDIKILVTGPHATTLPKETLESGAFDVVLREEPELIIGSLINCLDKKKPLDNIEGISFIKGKKITHNKSLSKKPDLDSLPFPARHKMWNYLYTAPLTKGPVAMISTSRGCPFNCTFCNAPNMYGKIFRNRSAKNVLAEISSLSNKYKIKNIAFYADTFTLDKNFISSLCEGIIKSKSNIKWVCNSRVDTLDQTLVTKMKRAGCWLINFGVESGVQEILDANKKGIKLEKVRQAFKITKRAGILRVANFILGLQEDNNKTIKQTIKFSREIDPDFIYYFIATPYPGTEFFEYVKKNNLLQISDWDNYSQTDSAAVRTKDLTSSQLEAHLQKAYNQFFMRPGYLIKVGTHVLKRGGFKTTFKAGLNFLGWFAKK